MSREASAVIASGVQYSRTQAATSVWQLIRKPVAPVPVISPVSVASTASAAVVTLGVIRAGAAGVLLIWL